MMRALKKALVPAAVSAFIFSSIVGTPELLVFGILTLVGFAVGLVGAVAFWYLASVNSWSPGRQLVGIWVAAAFTEFIGHLTILAPVFFDELCFTHR